MNATSQAHPGSRLLAVAGLTGVLVLAACASTPPAPTSTLQAAHQAITNAERTDAGRHAPAELREAQLKLASAHDAVTEKNMIAAERFAAESRAAADLASARAMASKANAVNAELERSTSALIEEIQRSSGDKR
jgi:hypothetical protein